MHRLIGELAVYTIPFDALPRGQRTIEGYPTLSSRNQNKAGETCASNILERISTP